MEKWEDKAQVKKGNFGENIVHKFLEDQGYIVYSPETSGPHAFDRLAIKDKKRIIIADIKTKAKLNKFDETGIDLRHYQEYKNISEKHNIPVYIFFVDEMLGEIYGNFLSELEKGSRQAPWGKQILFQMNRMKRNIYKLSVDEVKFLEKNSTRKYKYEENKMSQCRSCGKEIMWVKTPKGKNMPIDFNKELEHLYKDGAPVEFDRSCMVSHFDTCANADEHRKQNNFFKK